MAFSRLRRLGTFSFLAGIGLMAQVALAGTLTNVSVTPADSAPGATTSYTFQYTVEQDVYQDEALLYVTFPSGFTVAGSGCGRITSITLIPNMGATVSCEQSYGTGNTVGFTVTLSNGGSVIGYPVNTVVTVIVGGVTNPSVAGNYDFDPAGGINSSTGIYTTNLIDPGNPTITAKDVAPKQTVTIGTLVAQNGACGVAHGKVIDVSRLPPSSELCAVDVEFGYRADATRAYWGCKGKNGGIDTPTDTCSATKGHLVLAGPFPFDSGTVSCSPNPVVTGGSTVCTPTPAPGFMFDNWTGDCTGASCAPTNVTGILYIDANFVAAQYPITISVNPSTAGSVSCTSNPVTHGNNTTCTYTANPGYTFTSWSGACTGATCALTNLTSAKSVTANFTAPNFNITVNTSGTGTASCTPTPVSGGSNSTCTATPSAGNTFTGWSGDCAGSSCVLTSVNANKSVTANFAPATYSISGTASPTVGGSVSCGGNITHGGNGSCSASANTGYAFASWSGCPSASGSSCNFTNVTSSQSVTANFTANSYTVAASANPVLAGSAACVSPVTHGGNSSCTAKATTGYRFSNWSGACTGSDCFITNVTGNSTAVANFVLIPTYNVSTSVAPVDSGKITCTKDIIEGGTGTCTAKANPGYRLISWGGDCSGNVTSCSLANVTSVTSVSAIFEQADTFNINVSLKLAGESPEPMVIGDTTGYLDTRVECTAPNPITKNTTVTCTAISDWDKELFRGWGGDCTRIEGRNCIIENMANDKSLTIYTGHIPFIVGITPVGAGNLWCNREIQRMNMQLLSLCEAEANPGYSVESVGLTQLCNGCALIPHVTFKKQVNTPVVECSNCTSSTLATDTTTTQVASKISEPNEQGNSIQSTVAITTNTTTGGASTTVNVSNQDANGATQSGTRVTTNNPNAEFSVVNSNETTGTLNNPATEESTNVVVTSDKVTTSVSKGEQKVGEVITGGGQTAAVNTTETGTTVAVTDSTTGATLGTTTVAGNTTTTTTSTGSTQSTNAATTTTYDSNTVTSSTNLGSSTVTSTSHQATTAVTFPITSSQMEVIVISGGIIGGNFIVRDNVNGVDMTYFYRSATPPPQQAKTGLRKTAAAEGNNQALIDISGGQLQSVQLNSDSNGVVEFFKPGVDAGSPQMTAFESTEDTFSITLSYPATK